MNEINNLKRSVNATFSTKACLLAFCLIINGCASPTNDVLQNAFDNAMPLYADDALKFDIKTTADLNSYHQQANSCTVFIVQAQEREILDKLISNVNLLQGLINGEQKEHGVLQLDKITLMPQQHVQFTLPRITRSRFVAIIPGYYPAPNSDISFVIELPLKLHKQGWMFPDYTAEYIPLSVTMTLGRLNVIQEEFIPQGDQFLLSENASVSDGKNTEPNNFSVTTVTKKVGKSAFEQLSKVAADGTSTFSQKIPSGSTGKP